MACAAASLLTHWSPNSFSWAILSTLKQKIPLLPVEVRALQVSLPPNNGSFHSMPVTFSSSSDNIARQHLVRLPLLSLRWNWCVNSGIVVMAEVKLWLGAVVGELVGLELMVGG